MRSKPNRKEEIMKMLSAETNPQEFIGMYGPRWRAGLLSEHLYLYTEAGGEFRPANTFAGWAVIDGKAFPVLCSELVRIETEDGPISGRCGEFATDFGCCSKHQPY